MRLEPSTLEVRRLAKLQRKAKAAVIGQAQADAWYCRFMGKAQIEAKDEIDANLTWLRF